MATFKDSTGNEWDVSLTVLVTERVHEEHHIDIHELLEDKCKGFIDLEQPRNAGKFLRLIYAIVQPQAKDRGVDQTAFMNAMDGESIESAWEVFRSAFVGFIRHKPIRCALQKLIDKQGELRAEAAKQTESATQRAIKIAEKLAREQATEISEESLEAHMRAEFAKATKSGEQFGGSPATSVSTLAS